MVNQINTQQNINRLEDFLPTGVELESQQLDQMLQSSPNSIDRLLTENPDLATAIKAYLEQAANWIGNLGTREHESEFRALDASFDLPDLSPQEMRYDAGQAGVDYLPDAFFEDPAAFASEFALTDQQVKIFEFIRDNDIQSDPSALLNYVNVETPEGPNLTQSSLSQIQIEAGGFQNNGQNDTRGNLAGQSRSATGSRPATRATQAAEETSNLAGQSRSASGRNEIMTSEFTDALYGGIDDADAKIAELAHGFRDSAAERTRIEAELEQLEEGTPEYAAKQQELENLGRDEQERTVLLQQFQSVKNQYLTMLSELIKSMKDIAIEALRAARS